MTLERSLAVAREVGSYARDRQPRLRAGAHAIAISASVWLVWIVVADLCRPRMSGCSETKPETAGIMVRKLAYEMYPAWRLDHPDERCPPTLASLVPYGNDGALRLDPWGAAYRYRCVHGAAPVFSSAGEDATWHTGDDITSDDRGSRR